MNNTNSVYSVQSLNLTEKGFALLAQFPSEALEYADKRVMAAATLQEPFAYFMKVAKNYCQERGLETDYAKTTRLMSAYQINPSMANTTNQEINRPSKGTTSQSSHPVKHSYDLDAIKKRLQDKNRDEIASLQQTDPTKYARIQGRIQTMCNMLGIDEDGSILDENNPPTMNKFVESMTYINSGQLVPVFEDKKDRQINPPAPLVSVEADEVVSWYKAYRKQNPTQQMLAFWDKQISMGITPEVIRGLTYIRSTTTKKSKSSIKDTPNSNDVTQNKMIATQMTL